MSSHSWNILKLLTRVESLLRQSESVLLVLLLVLLGVLALLVLLLCVWWRLTDSIRHQLASLPVLSYLRHGEGRTWRNDIDIPLSNSAVKSWSDLVFRAVALTVDVTLFVSHREFLLFIFFVDLSDVRSSIDCMI